MVVQILLELLSWLLLALERSPASSPKTTSANRMCSFFLSSFRDTGSLLDAASLEKSSTERKQKLNSQDDAVLEELATWTVEDTDALLDYAMKYAPSETRGEPSQELFRAMRVAAAVEVCDWPFSQATCFLPPYPCSCFQDKSLSML